MKAESLEELGTAFRKWRAMKRHLREAMPKELVERARRTARIHGVREVARAVKVDGRRLEGTMGVWRAKQGYPLHEPVLPNLLLMGHLGRHGKHRNVEKAHR